MGRVSIGRRTMLRRVAGATVGMASLPWRSARAAGRRVTDSAGRSVAIPDRIARVFAAGPPATIILYTLAPDRLTGWTRAIRADEAEFMPARYASLPELGRLTGRGDTANVEVVLAAAPDLIFDYGKIDATYASLADRVQERIKLPYVLVDGGFDRIPEAYRQLGGLLGVEARAERLATYAERLLRETADLVDAIPEAKRPRVFYGRGPEGLDTGLKGSINVEVLERVGAINVAESAGEGGLATVSLEQVLAWDPEVILTLDRNFFQSVGSDPRWASVSAVRRGRVHLGPDLPFGWFDRPPSVNRLIGVRWLTHVLHPGLAAGDLRDQTREFYELFYHHDLTEPQLNRLLADAAPAKP